MQEQLKNAQANTRPLKEDLEKQNMRLILSANVGRTIKTAMHLLGIEVPERM